MKQENVVALAHAITAEGVTVRAYCATHGLVYSTLMSRCARSGLSLGLAVRRHRLAKYALLRSQGLGVEDAALRCGYYNASSLSRAKRGKLIRERVA